jgi:hypothetical protein
MVNNGIGWSRKALKNGVSVSIKKYLENCVRYLLYLNPIFTAKALYRIYRFRIYLTQAFDRKILLAKKLGTFLWINNQFIYEDIALENYLIRYANKRLVINQKKKNDSVRTLQILSEAYDTGGHTRVCEIFSGFEALGPNEVLVTRKISPNAQKFFEDKRIQMKAINIAETPSKQVIDMVEMMLPFSNILLHIHPDDILTVVAVGLFKNRKPDAKVCLYNHADHVFSYGFGVADRVLEITNLGWSKREARQSIGSSTYVGIPIMKSQRNAENGPNKNNIKLVSSGASYKYLKNNCIGFFDILDGILSIKNVTIEVYGPGDSITNEWEEYINKYAGRLIVKGSVPSEDYKTALTSADLYLDSFPISGGTAFPQGLLACGVALGLRIPLAGFSPADHIRAETISHLVSLVERYIKDPSRVRQEFSKVVAQTEAVHSYGQVEDRLRSAIETSCLLPPPFDAPNYSNFNYFEKLYDYVKIRCLFD